MSTYTCIATDLLTGETRSDTVPLQVQSFSRALNGAGSLSATLDLQQQYDLNTPYVGALEARKCVLWVLQDSYPVWAGVVWDWPHETMQGGTLPIKAASIESVWDYRRVTATISYSAVDLFTAFVDMTTYGMTKTSPYITATSPTPAPTALVQAAARVARVSLPAGLSAGVPWTATYVWSDLRKVSDVWNDMCASGNMEYAFEPGLDANGELTVTLRLGYTGLGRPVASSGIVLSYPGNSTDYGYPRTGSQSSNYIWATAPPAGTGQSWLSAYPHGVDTGDLGEGYPLMEDTASWNGSTAATQAQVNGFADGQVQLKAQAMTQPTVVLGGGSSPKLKDIVLGDSALLAATSALHPPQAHGEPGLQKTVRITGWSCTPPGPGQAESVTVTTSAIVVPR